MLSNKRTKDDYVWFFNEVKSLMGNYQPSSINLGKFNFYFIYSYYVLDFELPSSQGFLEVFPLSKIDRCLFHLKQSVWRKVKDKGLISVVNSNVDARK